MLHEALQRFLAGLRVLPWPFAASTHYVEMCAQLELSGKPISGMDILIAAHALSERAILVGSSGFPALPCCTNPEQPQAPVWPMPELGADR